MMDDATAAKLVLAIAESEARYLFDQAILRMAEKAALQDLKHRNRSWKGAIGVMLEAQRRDKNMLDVAEALIRKRQRPFSSYRQLAAQVAKAPGMERTEETIRRRLAKLRILDKTS